MLRHWIAEQPDGPAKWTLKGLDPDLHLTDDFVDLSGAEQEEASLWEEPDAGRQPPLAGMAPRGS